MGRSEWMPCGVPAELHNPKPLQAGPGSLALETMKYVIIVVCEGEL